MDFIKNIIRMSIVWFTFPLVTWWGSRKLTKQVKKNKKEQDPNLYPFDERWKYLRKKSKGILKRNGVKVEVEGMENIPKGGAWITPNHTSNLDGIYLTVGLGGKSELVPVAKDVLKDSKMFKGYFIGADALFLDRSSIRQNLNLLNGAAQYAKERKRSVVIFPEGTRSLTGELLDFKNGLFKFPQKYFLPIVPVTILGTLQARNPFSFKTRIVKIIVSKPIKPINHSKMPTDILGKKIKKAIQTNIDDYIKSLSEKELSKLNKIKKISVKKEEKKNIKLDKEINK